MDLPQGNLLHANLLLARHGESETNASNAFSGRANPELTPKGIEQAKQAGLKLTALDLKPDRVFTSEMRRCQQTTRLILDAAQCGELTITCNHALNERDYGLLTGMDKTLAAEKFGKEQVQRWRRSYYETPPDGESLQDTAARVLAYYVRVILPATLGGGTTLIVSHGNTLRSLIMALDGMSAEEVEDFDISTGSIHHYKLTQASTIIAHDLLT